MYYRRVGTIILLYATSYDITLLLTDSENVFYRGIPVRGWNRHVLPFRLRSVSLYSSSGCAGKNVKKEYIMAGTCWICIIRNGSFWKHKILQREEPVLNDNFKRIRATLRQDDWVHNIYIRWLYTVRGLKSFFFLIFVINKYGNKQNAASDLRLNLGIIFEPAYFNCTVQNKIKDFVNK